jgi:hypothetical protein
MGFRDSVMVAENVVGDRRHVFDRYAFEAGMEGAPLLRKRGANFLDATLEARVTKALGTNKGHSPTLDPASV